MLLLLFLGFSSGLPIKLVFSTLTLWLMEVGINKATVGVFALASIPYSLKFLWAPAIDVLRVPVLTRILGRRRAWMLVTQLSLVVALVFMAMTSPFDYALHTGIAALIVAFCSASQDIVLDGYRVELLEPTEQGAGTASFIFGYRLGMLAAGAGALRLVTIYEGVPSLSSWRHSFHGDGFWYQFAINRDAWSLSYLSMAALMIVGIVATFIAREPAAIPNESADPNGDSGQGAHSAGTSGPLHSWARIRRALYTAVIEPFALFMRRRGWVLILGFIFLYKLGDSLAGSMTNPFLLEIGFTRDHIASIRETYGLFAGLAGTAIGGLVVRALGIRKTLWIALALMMGSNLLFIAQYFRGADLAFLALTIGIENTTGGLGSAAFVAYLSALCDRRFAATQYALLTSLAAFAHITFGATSGWLAIRMGWPVFFAFTALTTAPACLFLWRLQKRRAISDDGSTLK